MKSRGLLKRIVCAVLCAALCAVPAPTPAQAAVPKTLVLEQAQRIAQAGDPAIQKKHNQILLKKMKYEEAVKTIKAKVKNLRSFRWSPLLSFKFPQKLDLMEDYDLNIKPLTLQSEIITLQHEKNDLVFELNLRVSKLFISLYVGQERIAFIEKILLSAQEELTRNEARLLLGTASQADVDTCRASLMSARSDLALCKRTFENDKAALSDLLGIDVTTGYVFQNPFRTMDINRDQLALLVEYTLENDHIYYAARMAESVARLNLDSYEKLFRTQYGSKVNAISVFLNQARSGQDPDAAAFKESYDAMLKSFDKPWDGKVTIIFFTFTMEWLKGQISGTRYIEDEMYALYTAALEYLTARKDKEAAEKDLRKRIAADYELLVTMKNALGSMLAMLEETGASLTRMEQLNRTGRASFDEVKDKQNDYQQQQNDAIEQLALYNEMLYDFDRLTCGGVTKLMQDASFDTNAGAGGDSRLDVPTYTIYTDIADMLFVFGVQIPDGYDPAIDAYELWYEGTQIGERTPVGRTLRHLALDYGESYMLTVRLYEGDTYVDECVIDTTIPTDVLQLKGAVVQEKPPEIVGYYTIQTEQRQGVSMTEIKLSALPGGMAQFYRISFNSVGLFTGEPIALSRSFRYLSLLSVSIADVRVELYDISQQLMYTATFEPSDQSLRVAS